MHASRPITHCSGQILAQVGNEYIVRGVSNRRLLYSELYPISEWNPFFFPLPVKFESRHFLSWVCQSVQCNVQPTSEVKIESRTFLRCWICWKQLAIKIFIRKDLFQTHSFNKLLRHGTRTGEKKARTPVELNHRSHFAGCVAKITTTKQRDTSREASTVRLLLNIQHTPWNENHSNLKRICKAAAEKNSTISMHDMDIFPLQNCFSVIHFCVYGKEKVILFHAAACCSVTWQG